MVKRLRLFIREIREIKEIKEVREMVSSEILNSLNSLNSLLTFHLSPFTFEAKLRNASTFYKSRAKRTILFTFQFSLFSLICEAHHTFEAKLRNASTFYKTYAKHTTLFRFHFSVFSFFYYLCFVLCAYK